MCMICRGLKNNKLSAEEAKEKYEEFLDLDLIDEDHQEEIESLIAEAESDELYWLSAKKDYFRSRQDYVDTGEDLVDEDFLDRDDTKEDDE